MPDRRHAVHIDAPAAAPADHAAEHFRGAEQRATQVDFDNPPDFVEIGFPQRTLFTFDRAGVVDEQVDRAECALCCGDERTYVVADGDIRANGDGAAATAGDFSDDVIERSL